MERIPTRDQHRLQEWLHPEGVHFPGEDLRYLYVTDEAHNVIAAHVSHDMARRQRELKKIGRAPTIAVMAMMGALYPASRLADHFFAHPELSSLIFTTVGGEFYGGPGRPLENPRIVQKISIPVGGANVWLVEDLGDSGRSLNFIYDYLMTEGVRSVSAAMFYSTEEARDRFKGETFIYYSQTPEDTWIITPRERVETIVKLVPEWLKAGLSFDQIYRRFILIGYPQMLLDMYLEDIVMRSGVS